MSTPQLKVGELEPDGSARPSDEEQLDKRVISRQAIDRALALELRDTTHLSICNCFVVTDWSFLHEGLESLRLENLSYGGNGPASLPAGLQELIIRKNLSKDRVDWLQDGLISNKLENLISLEMSMCSLYDGDFILDEAGAEPKLPSSLQHLNLSDNLLSNLLWLSSTNLPNLISFNVSDCHLQSRAVDMLIYLPQHLQTLDLSFNELGAAGAQTLLSHFGNRSNHLQNLNLECCWLGHQGAKCVAQIVQMSSTLESLNVADNAFGDIGAIYIVVKGLQHSTTLTRLHLDANNISNQGVAILASSIVNHPSLAHLHLSRNGSIKTEGWTALGRAVAKNKRLKTLDTSCGIVFTAHPAVALIRLHLDVLRTSKFSSLVREERAHYWPVLIHAALSETEWGLGLVFEWLRHKPTIVLR
jgi:hypothetical protein